MIVINQDKVNKKAKDKAIQEAKKYLLDTDFYFIVDKYSTLDETKKLELEAKRLEARGVINGNY